MKLSDRFSLRSKGCDVSAEVSPNDNVGFGRLVHFRWNVSQEARMRGGKEMMDYFRVLPKTDFAAFEKSMFRLCKSSKAVWESINATEKGRRGLCSK